MPSDAPIDLRAFLQRLRREGELVEVDVEVDRDLEIAEIHRRVIAADGPALLFNRPKGAGHRLVTNLFGTRRRVELAFGDRGSVLVERLARLPHEALPPTPGKLWAQRDLIGSLLRVGTKRVGRGPVLECREEPPRLGTLPAIKTWSEDGGRFFTLPLVLTEHPEGLGSNLGMYRMQVYDDAETGMHFQIGKGGGHHLDAAERLGRDLPLNVVLGGPPAMILAAIAPLPENVPELLFASLVLGSRLRMVHDEALSPLPFPADAEVVLVGRCPRGVRRPEGPFGDHYGYYSLTHDFPVMRVDRVLKRADAIVPATVVGKPRQEDFYIGDLLQEMLAPLFPLVMPQVIDLWSYGETGYHSLAAAVVRERHAREAMTAAFRILGEGQLSLTKFLLLTDGAVDLRDFRATLEHVLARCRFPGDLALFGDLAMDTLDYTGPRINHGSKGVLVGVGEPVRDLPGAFSGELPQGFGEAVPFCRGCLVVAGPTHRDEPQAAARLAAAAALDPWPLVVLVDDARAATRSVPRFLWTTFTRFEPAGDVAARSVGVERNRAALRPPIVIDARFKPTYPDELFCDRETADLVTRRWSAYFPDGLEMGDSDVAHLD